MTLKWLLVLLLSFYSFLTASDIIPLVSLRWLLLLQAYILVHTALLHYLKILISQFFTLFSFPLPPSSIQIFPSKFFNFPTFLSLLRYPYYHSALFPQTFWQQLNTTCLHSILPFPFPPYIAMLYFNLLRLLKGRTSTNVLPLSCWFTDKITQTGWSKYSVIWTQQKWKLSYSISIESNPNPVENVA